MKYDIDDYKIIVGTYSERIANLETENERLRAACAEMRAALEMAVAQLEADHDGRVASEMFGGEPDPARAMSINRYDVTVACQAALAAHGEQL